MRESEQRSLSKSQQKEKIRKRYERAENSNVTIIPAKPQKQPFDIEQHCRVGIYARVSTDDPNQTSSYELQKNYYEEMVSRNPNWELVGIYADEGISGTSLEHRDEFMRLIQDCMDDKIDLTLSVNASMAQEESHIKSVGMNRSIEMRYSMNIFLTPVLLGYDHDEDGNLIINPTEAKTVRLIFLMYLCGYKTSQIADEMTRLKRVTKIGNEAWSAGSIYGILRNERHCGDILARKTFTPDYLNHKSIKNDGDRPQYYAEDDHEAIVSREMYLRVQEMMDQSKYGFRNGTPELRVISGGVLKGFVQINPCWMGYTMDDYLNACQSVLEDKDYLNPIIQIRMQSGDYDFREYQVTREQFVPTTRRISASLTNEHIKFSRDAIDEFKGKQYIEILYHPFFEMMVVRASNKKNKHAIKWSVYDKDRYRSCRIRGTAFMPIIYDLMDWNKDDRYTLVGFVKEQSNSKILVFYTCDAEKRIYQDNKMRIGYRKDWTKGFGDKYLKQLSKTQAMFNPDIEWKLDEKGVIANADMFKPLSEDNFEEEMEQLRKELEDEAYGL